jgi:hypothetical protein
MLQYNIAQVSGASQDKFADSLVVSCDFSYFTEHALSKLHKDPTHKEACDAISGKYNKIGSVNLSPIYRQKEGFELFLSRGVSDFAHTYFFSLPDRRQITIMCTRTCKNNNMLNPCRSWLEY